MGSPCTRVSRVREVSSESGGISGPYVTRPIARAVVLGGPVPRSATYEPRVPRVAQYPNGPRAFPRSAANNRVCTGVRLQPHSKRCGRSSSHRCILQPQRALLRDPASLSGRGSQRQAHDPVDAWPGQAFGHGGLPIALFVRVPSVVGLARGVVGVLYRPGPGEHMQSMKVGQLR